MGSDWLHLAYRADYGRFNSRSRMGSDAVKTSGLWNGSRFQFTLPHGERHARTRDGGDGRRVSIHAPAWGATFSRQKRFFATFRFNSRSRMGSDLWFASSVFFVEVSIHAPAWGATIARRQKLSLWKFQFTLPHGERLPSYSPPHADDAFQFTLPHGERHYAVSVNSRLRLFQFTLPHGERLDNLHRVLPRKGVSIHAPAWGATSGGGTPNQ